jgi:predicted DCC family thiol-disulfide oxidoreductase YuxK
MKNAMQKLFHAWEQYWFQPASLFHLALCRIIIVSVQLYRIFSVTYGKVPIKAQAADHLYDPLPILHLFIAPFGWNYRPDLQVLTTVLGIVIVTGFLSLLGIATNASLLIFALGTIFLQSFMYAFGDLHHPETLMMIALFVLALAPCGRVLSGDDFFKRLSQASPHRTFEPFDITQEKSPYARWPFLLMQWMFAWMYLSAALEKWEEAGLQWTNGYTMQYYWASAALHYDIPIGFWLSQQHYLSIFFSWLSMILEGTFFLAVLFPVLAWFYVPLALSFHFGIAITMKAYFYQYMSLYCLFFIPWVPLAKTLKARLSQSAKPEIFYDGLCILCVRSMTGIRYFDWFDKLQYTDLENANGAIPVSISMEDARREMHVCFPDGKIEKGFFAFRRLVKYLPMLWPVFFLFYLPFSNYWGPRLYRAVASARKRVEIKCDTGVCVINS